MKFRKLVYIQVHPGYFVARVLGGPESIRRNCPGLDHPRTLAGDFHAIHEGLRGVIRELSTPLMKVIKPYALVHLVPRFEGGYTNIELRAFKEAVEAAGAHQGFLCDDKYGPLSDSQLSTISGATGWLSGPE